MQMPMVVQSAVRMAVQHAGGLHKDTVFLLLAGLCTLLYGISMVLLVRAFRRAKERVETQKGAAASESGDKPTEPDPVTDK